jgi:hypothetical protein
VLDQIIWYKKFAGSKRGARDSLGCVDNNAASANPFHVLGLGGCLVFRGSLSVAFVSSVPEKQDIHRY